VDLQTGTDWACSIARPNGTRWWAGFSTTCWT